MKFNMAHTSEGRSIIVILNDDGGTDTITDSHPNYVRIAVALVKGQDHSEWLNADHRKIVENLSARISLVDGVLHYDGDPVYDGLSTTIQRYHAEGRDANNLVRFMERLSANPSAASREQLFTWTQAQNLTIDTDGFVVGYKGVSIRDNDQDFLDAEGQPLFSLEQYPYKSSNAGHGIVDGIEINGHLPMGVGAVIEMPRNEVNEDPDTACSTGLHVGTHAYALGYSTYGALLEVKFDPADVASVPRDSGFAKLRCCRYVAVAIHQIEDDDLTAYEPDATFDEDEAMDSFVNFVPPTFLARLKDRIKGRGKA